MKIDTIHSIPRNAVIRLAILLFVLTAPFILRAQVTQLNLAFDVWPPFTNEPGKTSVAEEIVKTALNRNSIGVKPRIVDFPIVLKGLEEGTFQGSPSLWKTSEREEYLIYSKPFLHNQIILVGKKGANVSAKSLNELEGKRIALVKGYAYGEEVLSANGVEFIEGKNDQANLLALLEGKVDYMLVDALLVAYLRSYQPKDAEKFLALGEAPLVSHGLYFAMRKDVDGAEEIMASFNKEIDKMKVDGTYHRILKLSWIQVDVDGDGTLEMIPGKNAGQPSENPYALNGPASTSARIYHNGQHTNWSDLPDDVKRTGINQADVQDVTFLSFGL